jgi:hypothetical protein
VRALQADDRTRRFLLANGINPGDVCVTPAPILRGDKLDYHSFVRGAEGGLTFDKVADEIVRAAKTATITVPWDEVA